MRSTSLALILLLAAPAALAAVRSKEIAYEQDGTKLKGFVTWDDAWKEKRPGVLVVHEWWGQNEHARNQALRLAKDGYVGFALDMYGDGKVAEHPADAQAFAEEATKSEEVMAARFDAALAVLKADEHVDPERIAAIGYCFGGAVALGMARRGADLDAVVTFHASLATEKRATPGSVKAAILVNNGADDPMVSADAIAALKKEMADAGVDFELVNHPGAKHSFTNPEAGTHGMPQLAYDEKADKRSWKKMLALFRRVFGA